MRNLFTLILVVIFSGCVNDDNQTNNNNQTEIVGSEGILQNLKSTNIDDSGFPWYNVQPTILDYVRLKSWNVDLDGLIPVKTNGLALASETMDEIEQEIGKTIFDRTSIASLPNEQITRGIIISEGTALGAFGSTDDPNGCGHVSEGIGTTAYPVADFNYQYDDETGDFIGYSQEGGWYDSTGNINTVLYVHIGATACQNEIDRDLVVHEFGHALGMGAHFNGFGFGPAVDGNFWNVLHAMYNNPTGTLEEDIVINQIKF
jgi:hypothetical protein